MRLELSSFENKSIDFLEAFKLTYLNLGDLLSNQDNFG